MLSCHTQPMSAASVSTISIYIPFISVKLCGPLSTCQPAQAWRSFHTSRSHNQDQRSRLSRLWVPTGGIAASTDEDAHSKLVRAGFLRQAHSGIFHMLPLGYRVQVKVEQLLDKHMKSLGASRLDLSSVSSPKLWAKSGRLSKRNSELFQFIDRRKTRYLLSPTHEEEITDLVANAVKSFRDLPIRLYQISRKYRDELRPRHGLLRSREFVMKDLYTFDDSPKKALATYELVHEAYTALFSELKIPYLVAEADSGDMGGTLSHEFHFLTPHGEDHVVSCQNCDYVANEELAETPMPTPSNPQPRGGWTFIPPEHMEKSITLESGNSFTVWRGLCNNRLTLVNVWYPLLPRALVGDSPAITRLAINMHSVKMIIPDVESAAENAAALWSPNFELAQASGEGGAPITPNIVNLVDCRLPATVLDSITWQDSSLPIQPKLQVNEPFKAPSSVICREPSNDKPLNLLRIQDGDTCPRCGENQLKVQTAIELGHTFFLGTRYSEPFNAVVSTPPGCSDDDSSEISVGHPGSQNPLQMGCHGIGVSRMIGAVAETLADTKGLNWPRVIAPYEVVVVPAPGNESDAISVHDLLIKAYHGDSSKLPNILDVVLDDRAHSFAWKMRDSDLIGYPVIVVVGKGWKTNRSCEVQCRRLGTRVDIPLEALYDFVQDLLAKL